MGAPLPPVADSQMCGSKLFAAITQTFSSVRVLTDRATHELNHLN